MSTEEPDETDEAQTESPALPGFTLVEVSMRLYIDEDGDLDHQTVVSQPEGNLPPLYAVLGAWEMAKDTIKEQYAWFEDGECDDPDCPCGNYEEDEEDDEED